MLALRKGFALRAPLSRALRPAVAGPGIWRTLCTTGGDEKKPWDPNARIHGRTGDAKSILDEILGEGDEIETVADLRRNRYQARATPSYASYSDRDGGSGGIRDWGSSGGGGTRDRDNGGGGRYGGGGGTGPRDRDGGQYSSRSFSGMRGGRADGRSDPPETGRIEMMQFQAFVRQRISQMSTRMPTANTVREEAELAYLEEQVRCTGCPSHTPVLLHSHTDTASQLAFFISGSVPLLSQPHGDGFESRRCTVGGLEVPCSC